MMNVHRLRVVRIFALTGIASISVASAATADVIFESGEGSTEHLGEFTGSISYFADLPEYGVLTITLTNTSNPSNGGKITGFVFNIDSSDPFASATLTSATHPFQGLTNHAAPPFGSSFAAGAALGGHWSGGGNPNPGIAVGQSGTFVFDVHASDAHQLAAESFLAGPYDFNFVVRLRGFADGGSDKVPAFITAIPTPASVALLALAGLTRRRRRRTE